MKRQRQQAQAQSLLAGAVTNFETFTANLSNSDTTYYAIVDNTNGDFEVGLGTFSTLEQHFARTTILYLVQIAIVLLILVQELKTYS